MVVFTSVVMLVMMLVVTGLFCYGRGRRRERMEGALREADLEGRLVAARLAAGRLQAELGCFRSAIAREAVYDPERDYFRLQAGVVFSGRLLRGAGR